MAAKKPIAFLSYAHSDDAHEGGKLRQLAERLSGEVQLLSGQEFPIFVDRKDLKVGHPWRAGIDGTQIRVLTWHHKISQSVIEAYRRHLNEPYPKRAVEQARRATADWRVLEKEYPQNVLVREYTSIPTMQGIIVHNRWAVLELIPYATHTNDRPALILTPERDSELFELFNRQFELLWDHCVEPVAHDGPPSAPALPTIT